MQLRSTQGFTFQKIQNGLRQQLGPLAQAQEQLSTGNRINRPSDDPFNASNLLSFERQLGNVHSYQRSIESVRPFLESAATSLESISGSLAEARAMIVGAMNGTLSQSDREAVASQLDQIREGLLESANASVGDRYLFGGPTGNGAPFAELADEYGTRVVFEGRSRAMSVAIGQGGEIPAGVPGDALFARFELERASYAGLSGVAAGVRPDSGTGFGTLDVRHDSTSGALGAGLAFVSGGASDTLLGDRQVVVDAASRTVRLGGGEPLVLPVAGDPGLADVRVTDVDGSELHLDFSAWSGADFTGTISGAGSVSFDGTNYVPLDFAETDLQLTDSRGRVIHVDTTGVSRAGRELVTFRGAANVFDTLAGIASDLRNEEGLDLDGQLDRVRSRLDEFDRNQVNVIDGLGAVGATLARAASAGQRLDSIELHLEGLIADIQSTDVTEAVLQLSRAEQTLQAAQAAGARLLNQSLLNFLS